MNSRRYRVLQVVETLHPGGAENVAATLAISLRQDLFEVDVAALSEIGTVEQRLNAAGRVVRLIGKHRGIDLGAVVRLRRFLVEGRYDLIHTHNPIANHWTVLACRTMIGAPPVIVTEHSIHYPGRVARWYPAVRTIVGAGNHLIIGVCDAVTESHKGVDPLNRAKYRTIHNGIEPCPTASSDELAELRRQFGFSLQEHVVGTVGNLRGAKAHDDLIEAFALLLKRFPKARLAIVGDGPLRADLRGRAERLGIGERVAFLGRRTDARRILPMFDVFALSSTREGFPVVVLEAAAAGVPIVATNVGGVSEVVQDGVTGRLVAPNRPDLLADALLATLEDPKEASCRASQANGLFLREFTARAMTRKVERLYAEVLGLQPTPAPLDES